MDKYKIHLWNYNNNSLKFSHQREIETANQISQKQELQRNQLLQQLNQLDNENRHDPNKSGKKLIPSKSKKL